MTDVHTHSSFSADSQIPLAEMIESAIEKGIRIYGVAEHVDYDFALDHVLVDGKDLPMIDLHAYFYEARKLQEKYADKIKVLVGVEIGFTANPKHANTINLLIARFKPDFIVNSVHTLNGEDPWQPEYYATRTKRQAYTTYLNKVEESLDCAYPYDIVAHLGYPSRKATYEDKALTYEEFPEEVDAILHKIIAQNKILEVNSSTRGAQSVCLPDVSILKRYYDLGGRRLSFASDAHDVGRIAQNREEVVALLKSLGFTHVTIPDENETQIPLE